MTSAASSASSPLRSVHGTDTTRSNQATELVGLHSSDLGATAQILAEQGRAVVAVAAVVVVGHTHPHKQHRFQTSPYIHRNRAN